MQGKRHDRVVEMRLCFFSGKVDDYKVQFESTRKCRSTVRDKIVKLMGDQPRVELFARQQTPGWDVWGNEVESTVTMQERNQ